MKEKTLIEVKFQELSLEVQKDTKHEWLLDTKSVAEGYRVAESTIKSHKARNADELKEYTHFIKVANCNSNPRAGIAHFQIFWTKLGVIRLGMFIKSERAIQFRDWAEKLIFAVTSSNHNLELKNYFDEKFRDLKNYVDNQNRDLKNYVDKKHEDLKQYINQTTFTKQDFVDDLPTMVEFMNFVWNTITEIRKSQKDEQELLERFSVEIANLKLDSVILVEAIKRILASSDTSNTKVLYYVYLFEEERGEHQKFGVSKDLSRRKKELERWDTLTVLHKIPVGQEKDALIIERLLKHLFQSKCVKGEWFRLSDEDIILVKSF